MTYFRCHTSDVIYVFSHKVGPQIVQRIFRFHILDAQPLYPWSGIASRQWGWTGEVAPFLGPAPKNDDGDGDDDGGGDGDGDGDGGGCDDQHILRLAKMAPSFLPHNGF